MVRLIVNRKDDVADDTLTCMVLDLKAKVEENYDNFHFSNALAEIFKVISRANKYIDENAPWVLAKDDSNKERLATVLYNLLETIRIVAVFLNPVMPNTTVEIWRQIGADSNATSWKSSEKFGVLPEDGYSSKGRCNFP